MNFCKIELPQKVRIQVTTDLNLLTQVLAWFEQFKQATIPYSVWLMCQLALAEGFTNAVRHAHRGKPAETPIEIEVTVRSQAIELRIWDCGSGFDLETCLNQPPRMETQQPGGWGLKIIKRAADVFRYIHTDDNRNCLLIVKNFSSPRRDLGEDSGAGWLQQC